ncbi:MAG: serine--pyruvate aminotransferase [Alphaproteobacteria bacterium]|nr:serine--pyruvate aminotransferase [Alphaproteobacteria bacterium]|tara:strand:+ start:1704 stop:3074 length:1371 start_codon:yes stop_codon:yes gene_type:complete
MSSKKLGFLNNLSKPFVKLVENFYPDAFIFVIVLSVLTFLLAVLNTDSTIIETFEAWGTGLPKLFTFTAQICIIMITAHALAHTNPVENILSKVGSYPTSQIQAYALVTFISGLASLFAWSFGLIVGGIVSKFVAIGCAKKRIRIHYPLLVASAYSGYVIWHMGYSSSAALFVSSAGHSLIDKIGVIPVTDTIFNQFNITVAIFTLLVITIVNPLMRPDNSEIKEIDSNVFRLTNNNNNLNINKNVRSPAQAIENNRFISFFLAISLLMFIGLIFYKNGFSLDLNIVSWSFLGIGLLLSNSPIHYVKLVNKASVTVGPIILQYPFYAGIMGIMADTGLINVLAEKISSIATAETLGFYSFLSGGLVNMFIPSGGGQWAVQGPVMIEAANYLNVKPYVIVLGVAYGDQWTNMIQPFWTIPLLAIAGLHMRQIMGYTFVIFIITGIIYGSAMLYLGAG